MAAAALQVGGCCANSAVELRGFRLWGSGARRQLVLPQVNFFIGLVEGGGLPMEGRAQSFQLFLSQSMVKGVTGKYCLVYQITNHTFCNN